MQCKVFTSQYQTGKNCVGWSESTFKQSICKHALFYRNKAFTKRMELSKHMWDLRKRNSDHTNHWSILSKVSDPHRNSIQLQPVPRWKKKTSRNHNRHANPVKQKSWTNLEMSQTYTNFVPINLLDVFFLILYFYRFCSSYNFRTLQQYRTPTWFETSKGTDKV